MTCSFCSLHKTGDDGASARAPKLGSEKGQCPHRGRPSTPKTYLEAVARTKSRASMQAKRGLGLKLPLVVNSSFPPLSRSLDVSVARTQLWCRRLYY